MKRSQIRISTQPEKEKAPRRESGGCLKTFLFAFIFLVVAVVGTVVYLGMGAQQVLDKITGTFKDGFFSVTQKVDASNVLIHIGRTKGDVLEVASPLKTMELFSRADTRYAGWGKIYLGTSTSEIKVPASYRYHIKLSELKGLKMKDRTLVVEVEAIYPSLPVAFDTAGMEKRSEDGWFRFDSANIQAELERSITSELAKRSEQHLPVVRENARKDIEDFVQRWIVESRPEHRDQIAAVKVIFKGEDEDKILNRSPEPVP
jgi:hypothetical protein